MLLTCFARILVAANEELWERAGCYPTPVISLVLDWPVWACKGPLLQDIPSPHPHRTWKQGLVLPQPYPLLSYSPKHCHWLAWEEHLNLCEPSFLLLIPRLLWAATKHSMLKTLQVSAMALRKWTKTNQCHSHTTAAPAAICKLIQCCNTGPLLSLKFCCRALAAKRIFFLWNLRCCKAARGFCQSFPFISLLRPPASHNIIALMLKLLQLTWLLLPALQRRGKCRDGMRRKRLFLCWVSFLYFVSFPLGKVTEVMIIRCVLAKARNPRNPVPYPFHAVNHWPWVENNLLMP